MLCCSEADVLDCDCGIDIGVVVVILSSLPRLRLICADYDVERCLTQPLALVALRQAGALLFALYDDEVPRLKVYGRGGQTCTLEQVLDLLALNGAVAIRTR